MDNPILKTSADDLYELVRSRKKMSVEEAAKILKMPINIVQSLVDFLVEERIFGIEYKFTTPYVYISEKASKKIYVPIPNLPDEGQSGKAIVTKEEFYRKASYWNLPDEKIGILWKKYVQENMDSIREDFYSKARLRNIGEEKIDALWEKYKIHLQ